MASTLQITSAPPLLAIPAINDEKMVMPLPEPESIRLAICANLEESGEATRALALARQIRDGWTGGRAIQITFLSCGSIYEPIIMEENFPIMHCEPRTERGSTAEGPKWKFPETAGTEQMACRYIRGQLKGLQQLRPDVVLHGMWPFGSIAARMLGLRTILFIPLPLHKACVSSGLVRDIPDEASLLARLPRRVRKVFAKVGSRLMMRNSMFHQASLGWAAYYSGWSRPGPMSLFDAVQADLTLITDLPGFHSGYSLPSNFIMTGPIYSEDEDAAYNGLPDEVDPEIVAHMLRDGRPVVLVMMGSMSNPEVLFETIRAVTPCRDPAGTPDMWNVLVVASPALCRSSVARSVAAGDPRVMVTDRFLPGPSVNELADVVVCHGGQGTIQTALSVGTPLVGVAMQLEQQINLDHVMDAGAGIRIQRQHWNADNIRAAVKKVIMDVNYQRAAVNLAMKMGGLNGARNAAVHIGEFIRRSV